VRQGVRAAAHMPQVIGEVEVGDRDHGHIADQLPKAQGALLQFDGLGRVAELMLQFRPGAEYHAQRLQVVLLVVDLLAFQQQLVGLPQTPEPEERAIEVDPGARRLQAVGAAALLALDLLVQEGERLLAPNPA
jgi:hypothetical protein